MSIIVSNIQRFCMHDGPGIRTTIFLKGCSIHCPWCSNPENINSRKQYYYNKSKCNQCNSMCGINPKCIVLNSIEKLYTANCNVVQYECPLHAIDIYGVEYTSEELASILLKDKKFWQNGGGVTFSGGEAMLWMREMQSLLELLKSKDIHMAVETALFVDIELLQIAIQYIDYFYVDIKILDKHECKSILGGDIEQYLKNVELLHSTGKTITFRIPCSEYTMIESNMILIKTLLQKYSDCSVELFKLHNLAESKYNSLGKDMWHEKYCVDDRMNELIEWMNGNSIIGRIISI